MKVCRFTFLVALILGAGCGGQEESTPAAVEESAPVATGEAAREGAAPEDECAPLERELVQYDAEGTPLPFHFSYPEGWNVNELSEQGTAFDFTYAEGDARFPDYVLRFMFTTRRYGDISLPLQIFENDSRTELTEETVDQGTLYLASRKDREIVQSLAPYDEGTHYTVTGVVNTAPDPCERLAGDTIKEIMRNLEPNRSIVPASDAE